MIPPEFVDVVVDLKVRSLDKPFTYKIPPDLKKSIKIGSVVKVPFRNRFIIGFVVGFMQTTSVNINNIKEISELLTEESFLGEEIFQLVSKMCSYYGCLKSEALKCFFSPEFTKKLVSGELKESLVEIPAEEKKESVAPKLELSPEQEKICKVINKSLSSLSPYIYLLHDIDGEEKTKVYLEAVKACLNNKRTAVVLVPEISLTSGAVQRYKTFFKDSVGIWHSKMSRKERLQKLKEIQNRKISIILGTRSAVFAPLKNIGLIIIDEEHDLSYKQEHSPRYLAHQIAFWRAQYHKAVVILGTSTPRVESFHQSQTGRYKYFSLSCSAINKVKPSEVEIVDMKNFFQKRSPLIFSPQLLRGIEDTLRQKKQVILFLNRRGFHAYILCGECGYIFRCPDCNISLTYHAQTKKLCCHHCCYKMDLPDICPGCKGNKFKYGGAGTQKVEEELKKHFSQVITARIDKDTVHQKGSYLKILEEFSKGRIQILLGTQKITRGLDYSNVGLAGVILVDHSLNIPDFRSQEHIFQSLSHIVGLPKIDKFSRKIIIQTYNPEHFSIVFAANKDYEAFYNSEIKSREETLYPPFCHLINCVFSGTEEKEVKSFIEKLGKSLLKVWENHPKIKLTGTAPCAIFKLRKRFRCHLILKVPEELIEEAVLQLKSQIEKLKLPSQIRSIIDTDPVNLL